MMFRIGVLLILSTCIGLTTQCADFLIFLNAGQSSRNAEATRELALSLANQIEIDAGIHRVALSTGTDPENEIVDFSKIKTNEELKQAIRAWQPEQLSIASKGIEGRLEKTVRLAIPQRRLNTAVAVVLIDDDGTSAFTTNPGIFGVFAEFVRKRHYVYTLLASRKAERIRTVLDFPEAAVDTASNNDELRLIASPFTKCQFRLANDLRRKPLPRINSASATTNGPVLTTENAINDQQSLIVTSRYFTVPVSIRFPTIKVSTTVRPTTTITVPESTAKPTTSKPKKAGCQFDIVMLFDLSSNSQDQLGRYKQMTLNLIGQSELGTHASQFALIRYSGPGRTDTAFHFNKHTNKTLLIKEIENVQPLGGTTRTAEAMRKGALEFDPKFGGRPRGEAQRHMIVFTNGYSRDEPTEVAQSLAHEQIHVFSVAVEDPNLSPDIEQLRLIASDKKSALLDAQFGKIVEQLAPSKCRL